MRKLGQLVSIEGYLSDKHYMTCHVKTIFPIYHFLKITPIKFLLKILILEK